MFQFSLSQNMEHIKSCCSRWWLERSSEFFFYDNLDNFLKDIGTDRY